MTLTIAVCVKLVPVATRLDPGTGRLDRSGAHHINAVDEHAVEAALALRDSEVGGEVVVVSVAPGGLADSLRPALAMGADRAVLVSSPQLEGADLLGTSSALATALSSIYPDLVVFGSWSGDGNGAMLWAAVGERLGLPVVSRAMDYALHDRRLTVTRQIEQGSEVVEVGLPAIIALSGEVNVPRYPSFRDVVAAKKKPIDQVAPALDGLAAGTTVISWELAPARTGGIVIEDDGHAHERLLEFLIERGVL